MNDPTYLRRVSTALRKQLSKPVQRVEFNNPVYSQGHSLDESPSIQAATAPQQPEHVVLMMCPSLPHARCPTTVPPLPGATLWQQQADSYSPSDQSSYTSLGIGPGRPGEHQQGQYPSQQHAPTRQGTHSGPYQGYASGAWLEVEMRGEVDDLAHCVDKYAARRYKKRLANERLVMEGQMDKMRQQVADATSKVTAMELMMPGEDGQYLLLRKELKDLEEDCDFYYKSFLEERKSKKSAQETIAMALGHLSEIEVEFARIKALVEQPAAAVAAVQAEEQAKAQAVIEDLQRQLQELAARAPVVPAMVLAAEKAVGRPPGRWPNSGKILRRLAMVLFLLACIAGSILGTYFLTRRYACI